MSTQPTYFRIEGNSYPVRFQLKAIGALWDSRDKHWWITGDKVDEAKAIVAKAPEPKPRKPFLVTCPCCGTKFDVNDRQPAAAKAAK